MLTKFEQIEIYWEQIANAQLVIENVTLTTQIFIKFQETKATQIIYEIVKSLMVCLETVG